MRQKGSRGGEEKEPAAGQTHAPSFTELLLTLFVGCMTGSLSIVSEEKRSFPQSLWHTLTLSHKKTRKATTMEPRYYVIGYIQNTNKISLINQSAYRQRARCPGPYRTFPEAESLTWPSQSWKLTVVRISMRYTPSIYITVVRAGRRQRDAVSRWQGGWGCDTGPGACQGLARCPLCKAAPRTRLSKQSVPTGCAASEGVSSPQSRAGWSQHARGSPPPRTGRGLQETLDEPEGLPLGLRCLPPTWITTHSEAGVSSQFCYLSTLRHFLHSFI